ncbi:unnamed protein product, partial [Hymenolepis diminuta]
RLILLFKSGYAITNISVLGAQPYTPNRKRIQRRTIWTRVTSLCLGIPKFWRPYVTIGPTIALGASENHEKDLKRIQISTIWINNFLRGSVE